MTTFTWLALALGFVLGYLTGLQRHRAELHRLRHLTEDLHSGSRHLADAVKADQSFSPRKKQ